MDYIPNHRAEVQPFFRGPGEAARRVDSDARLCSKTEGAMADAGILIGLANLIKGFFGSIKPQDWVSAWEEFRRRKWPLRVVPLPNDCWWCQAGPTPAEVGAWMTVAAHFSVANVFNSPVKVVSATLELKLPLGGHAVIEGMNPVTESPINYVFGENYSVEPGDRVPVIADFLVKDRFAEKGETLIGDVTLVDQFGHRYKIRRVRFACRG
jgi:hypothetical protein